MSEGAAEATSRFCCPFAHTLEGLFAHSHRFLFGWRLRWRGDIAAFSRQMHAAQIHHRIQAAQDDQDASANKDRIDGTESDTY